MLQTLGAGTSGGPPPAVLVPTPPFSISREEADMPNITNGLITLSVLAFLLAVVGSVFLGSIMGIGPEGFSRACSNLALIAIALAVTSKQKPAV
jgi:hypothetical protein